MPFCQSCGQQIPDGQPQCPNCGAPVMPQPFQQQSFQQQPFQQNPYQNQPQNIPNMNVQQPKKKGKGCLIAILVLFGLAFLSSLLRGGSDRTTTEPETRSNPEIHEEIETEPKKEATKKATTEAKKKTTTKPTTTTEEKEPETTVADDTIRPEFKEMIDSYEAFFDEYVAFMKNYSNSDNAFAMMGDYLDMIQKEAEYMEKLEALEESDMTSAELAYYTAPTARISQKLLSVAAIV